MRQDRRMSDTNKLTIDEYVKSVDSRIREIGAKHGLAWTRVEDTMGGQRPCYAAYSPTSRSLGEVCGVLAIVSRDFGVSYSDYPNVIAGDASNFTDSYLGVYAVIIGAQVTAESRKLLEKSFRVGFLKMKIIEFCLVDENLSLHLPRISHPTSVADVISPEELRYVFTPLSIAEKVICGTCKADLSSLPRNIVVCPYCAGAIREEKPIIVDRSLRVPTRPGSDQSLPSLVDLLSTRIVAVEEKLNGVERKLAGFSLCPNGSCQALVLDPKATFCGVCGSKLPRSQKE